MPPLEFLIYCVIRLVAFGIGVIPIEWASWISCRIGDLAYFVAGKRRKIALYNLDLAYGNTIPANEKKRIARKSFQNLITSVMEFMRTEKTIADQKDRFTLSGGEHLSNGLLEGKGVVFVMAHLGSWEYTAFIPHLLKFTCTVIGKSFRNRYLYRWIEHLRHSTGLKYADKNESIRVIMRKIKNNEVIALLIDQWAGSDGKWIPFFNVPTATTTFPVRLAVKCQAPIVAISCVRIKPGKYRLVISPEFRVDQSSENWEYETTLKINHFFEDLIKQYPWQWAWYHRRWKKRPKDI